MFVLLSRLFPKRFPVLVVFLFALCSLTACMSVDSFYPTSGTAGDEVTINGSGFGSTANENSVQFQGVPADIVSVPSPGRQIIAKFPKGANTGLVSVTNTRTGRTATSEGNFTCNTCGAEWTFMVYLDADNNLEPDGLNDFREMAEVGSSNELKIVVQMDRGGNSSQYGGWTDTRRFLIQRGDTPAVTPVQDMGELNMGDPAVLQDFVEWGITTYPARHYALILWNHGGGWRDIVTRMITEVRTAKSAKGVYSPSDVLKAICWDASSQNDPLYMREVQQAMAGAKARLATIAKVDLVGFDACLMGMVEVAYELRDLASYMVGSEDFEPGAGWPYNTILTQLAANTSLLPSDLAGMIVQKYYSSYTASSAVTQSALDIGKIAVLIEAIDAFATRANTEWQALKDARASAVQYHIEGYPAFWGMDLWDFADKASTRVASTDIVAACAAVKNAVGQVIINELHGTGDSGSHGVALYFPKTKADYDNDIDYPGYEPTNTTMPVDYVQQHDWSKWLKDFYSHSP